MKERDATSNQDPWCPSKSHRPLWSCNPLLISKGASGGCPDARGSLTGCPAACAGLGVLGARVLKLRPTGVQDGLRGSTEGPTLDSVGWSLEKRSWSGSEKWGVEVVGREALP